LSGEETNIDLLLINGDIVTFDEADSRQEAVAIKGDLIIAVGKNAEISQLAGPSTRTIDLHGRLVTPGLIDSHIHVASSGPYDKYALRLSYPKINSISDIVEAVKERVSSSAPTDWIKGVGWDEARLEEKRYVTRWDLDPVSPKNPVMLTHTSGHFVVVNSAAMKLAGIDGDSPQPEGGTIVRDGGTGELNGVLKELAINLVEKHVPHWTQKQLEEGIKYLGQELAKVGITSIKDGCTLEGLERECVAAYSSLAKRNELSVRAYMLWQIKNVLGLDALKDHLSYQVGDRFRLGGIKIFMDGSLMGRTAWCYDEFLDPAKGVDMGNRGYPVISAAEYEKIVAKARQLGYQVSTHAIGDRAIDTVLDTYEKIAQNLGDGRDCNYTIIHSTLATHEAIRRMKRLGMGVETQSSFLYFLSTAFERAIEPDRMLRLIPMKSFLDDGIIVGNGSDYFVAPFAPVYGIWAACTRESIAGGEISNFLGKGECITVHDALRTYTSMAAKCLLMADKIGSIEKRKLADLVVWAENLYEIPVEQIKDAKVAMTMVGGKVVYEDSGNLSQ
jgi:predicted amidohydrolase YtcJ